MFSYPVIRAAASLVFMTMAFSSMYAAVVTLAPAAAEFGTGRAGGSIPYTLFMVAFGIGNVVVGRVVDRVGLVLPALVGSVCLPIGFVLASYAQSMLQLGLALALFCGLFGAAVSFGPLVSDVSHWFTARRGFAVGIVISGSYLAGAVWPPIVQLMFDAQGWRETYRDLAIIAFCVMTPLCLVFYRKAPMEEAEAKDSATGNPSRVGISGVSPNTLQCLLCAAGVGCCVAMAMPQVHIVPYVIDLGYAAARGADMLAIMLGCGIVSRIASGWISDRIGGLNTLLLGSALQGIVLVAFLFADSLLALYLISAAFGLSQGGIVPSYAIIIRSLLPAREAGWRIGLALLFTILGMALGGWMAGALYDLTGAYTLSYLNAIGFNVLNLAIALAILRRAQRASNSVLLNPARS